VDKFVLTAKVVEKEETVKITYKIIKKEYFRVNKARKDAHEKVKKMETKSKLRKRVKNIVKNKIIEENLAILKEIELQAETKNHFAEISISGTMDKKHMSNRSMASTKASAFANSEYENSNSKNSKSKKMAFDKDIMEDDNVS
jgi:hypothetical protein